MNIEDLEKLNNLKEKGVISEEEFNKQKDLLLNSTESSNKTEVKGKENIVINNTINNNADKKTRKIGLFTIVGFILGALITLTGIMSILTGNFIAGIFYTLAGLVIFPLFIDFIEKKFNFKLSGFLTFIIFIVLIGIATSTVNKDSAKVTNSPNSSVSSTIINEQKTYNISESITTDKFEVTVASVQEKSKVGTQYFSAKPADGGIYVAVDIKYKNISSEPISSYQYPTISLVDNKGVKYSYDYSASSYYSTETDPNRKVLSDLNPQISVNDSKVFEVSKDLYSQGSWTLIIKDDKEYIVKIK